MFRLNMMTLIYCLDVFFNFIVQHEVDETKKTEYIKDSIKHYLKKKFWFDQISTWFFLFLTFLRRETKIRLLKDFVWCNIK